MKGADDTRVSSGHARAVARLRAEAKRLADLLEPSPVKWAADYFEASPELRAEVEAHWDKAAELERGLAEFAGWDGGALRAAAGPPLQVGYHRAWQQSAHRRRVQVGAPKPPGR